MFSDDYIEIESEETADYIHDLISNIRGELEEC
jgi:hypothetical protein